MKQIDDKQSLRGAHNLLEGKLEGRRVPFIWYIRYYNADEKCPTVCRSYKVIRSQRGSRSTRPRLLKRQQQGIETEKSRVKKKCARRRRYRTVHTRKGKKPLGHLGGKSPARTARLVYAFAYPNTPPQTITSPRAVAKCFTFAEGRAFVSVSATISSVGQ